MADIEHLSECDEFNKNTKIWCICPFLRVTWLDGYNEGLRVGGADRP